MWKEKPEEIPIMYRPGAHAYTLFMWLNTWPITLTRSTVTAIVIALTWASVSLPVGAASHVTPDLPPTGASLFDRLFLKVVDGRSRYQIPFPFEDLTRNIAGYLDSANGEADGSIAKLLIPMGRSLQRDHVEGRDDALADKPLRPSVIAAALFRELEMAAPVVMGALPPHATLPGKSGYATISHLPASLSSQ